MLVLDCDQGSPEWYAARLGIPTASNFSRIVTPTGKLSGQRGDYMAVLLAEWALGVTDELPDLYWIERGRELEPQARAYYEMITEREVERVGFVYRDDDRMVGCSPDWLWRDGDRRGGVEVKCPKAATHISYLLGGAVGSTYVPQVQGSMWVTGADVWQFVSYFPELPPLIVDVERDEKYHAALDTLMPRFLDEMLAARTILVDLGVTPTKPAVISDRAQLDDLVRDVAGEIVTPLA